MTKPTSLLLPLLGAVALAAGSGAASRARAHAAPDVSAALATIAAARDSAGARAPVRAFAPDRVEYLWVVRTALRDRVGVERVVGRAREMGVKGLLVQVVGRGDAFYRSDLLPRAESIREADLDPLGEIVARARAAGLEVHAWMNCMLVWSAPAPPRDPRHVVNAHPEWIARLADGRPMTALTARQRRRAGIEGVFLSPSHPGVRAWLGSIAREIAVRYPVAGVHLDYIRLPGVPLQVEAATAASVSAGGTEAARAALQRARIAAVVREVRDSLASARPGLRLSAAVLADTVAAERTHAQSWTSWLREGLIDRAFVMCYAPAVQTVLNQMLQYSLSLGTGGRVVPGIAVYNTPPAKAAAKIKAARELGFPELALYSFDFLDESPRYWPRLRSDLLRTPAGRAAGSGR